MFRTKSVVKAIDIPETATLELVKGEGYWYFVFDDIPNNVYETESVYVTKLNHLDLERWIEIGKAFVAKIKEDRYQ